MIERFYIKENLSFKECELNFDNGLIVFTGESGAGKSVLMSAVLSLFGFVDANASLIEAVVNKKMDMSDYGIEDDDPNIFKLVKSKTVRYFINSQTVSKKTISQISKRFVNYLSLKESKEFENESLLDLTDAICAKEDSLHVKLLEEFRDEYKKYTKLKERLQDILDKEKNIEELKEFARYEIKKIDEISPKVGEDEELMKIKKDLSKKEKLQSAIEDAFSIFDYESSVVSALALMDKNSTFFDDSMNELRAVLESQRDRLEELDDVNVEELLERIEKIASLKKRYGEIEDILEYRKAKIKELEEYENITFEKKELELEYKDSEDTVYKLASKLSKRRLEKLSFLNQKIDEYLKMLYMPKVKITLSKDELNESGIDRLEVNLGDINIKKISSGEYNRLRLAFLAIRSEYLQSDGGVLVLDEIDANLSGKESMSIAKVLEFLSEKYQILAISHQPQLSSTAKMHFLVYKNSKGSFVKLLNEEERIKELARMVSGEKINKEATEFARSLLKE